MIILVLVLEWVQDKWVILECAKNGNYGDGENKRGDMGTGVVSFIDAKFLISDNPIYMLSELIPVLYTG